MPTASRYIAHPPAGTGGATDFFSGNHPFGAGRGQLMLSNNAIWLEAINPLRCLASHPGFFNFNVDATRTMSSPPTASDIKWNVLGKDGGANASLGTHWVHPYPGGRWPQVKVTFRARVRSGGDTMGYVVLVCPGRNAYTSATVPANGVVMSTTFADVAVTVPLSPYLLGTEVLSGVPVGGTAPSETGTFNEFTIFIGAYVTGNFADLIGISAYLIPPP
jgi:hypothetical protein